MRHVLLNADLEGTVDTRIAKSFRATFENMLISQSYVPPN